jgi:hypothetical protein
MKPYFSKAISVKLADGSDIMAAASLLIGSLSMFRILAESYNAGPYKDTSIALLAMSFSDIRSTDFHKHVPLQFQDKLLRFHLWEEFIFKFPELIVALERLDSIDMGFLLQLEILCTDIPDRPCQQVGAPKCSGCRYKTRTVGVSANGRVEAYDNIYKNNNPITINATLMNATLRELQEEINIFVCKAAIPINQSRYRSVLTRMLAEKYPYEHDIKVPDLFYDYNSTRLQILFVGQYDVCPMFMCPHPDPWSHQASWDTYVATAGIVSWKAVSKSQPVLLNNDRIYTGLAPPVNNYTW